MGLMQDLTTIFFSIFLEALPYILLGTLISSFIQEFVSSDSIVKILPRGLIPGLILASLLGLILPVCDCGIVPIVRRLIQKEVPLSTAIAFMLGAPVINPVVLASTRAAFHSTSWMLSRAFFALIIAVWTGILINKFRINCKPAKTALSTISKRSVCCNHCHIACAGKGENSLSWVLVHAGNDFLDTARYFVFGALLAASIQVFVARETLTAVGNGPFSSAVVLMALAFGLSLCSEADAFVAATFAGSFPPGSLLAFLLLGPMIDLKNTFMLFSTFRSSLVITLISIIFISILMVGTIINLSL